ncbi:hypothetical protein KVT40_005044 [Elsinoe batatas]|uniref:Uncharacterized protein n=1 Tax=Elsinoe batatas TaxID=2601811 RepID=A0A8K0L4H4_9PEZI|nr:hypothetical protein KVT40_005044 [Elsinoe batatas]
MASQHPRRVSTAPLPGFDTVPPAPPLPPQQQQRYSQAKSAISRVFGIGGRQVQVDDRIPDRILPRHTTLSSSNATTVHRTGLPINSLSINESGTHALIGGNGVLKTLRVDGNSCVEDANLRSAIGTYNASLPDGGTVISRESSEIHDVAWAKGTTGNLIAAVSNNGLIHLYDLNRLGVEVARLVDHKRQVHRVTFNPHAGHYMLSAGHDGIVKMWDIRDCQRSISSFTSQQSTPDSKDPVRDVKWSPTNGTEFAVGTHEGWIQKWDTLMMRTAKVKMAAHSGSCSTIDWHPDGKHLMSAGDDKFVRIWNLPAPSDERLTHKIKTPFPIRNARWRPAFQSILHGDSGVRQCTQFVTSYNETNPVLHVWDLRRPLMPFRELVTSQTSATDLLWHSQDLLWTVGREGTFTQSDVSFAKKTIDHRNVQAFGLSPQGDINLVTQTRRPKSEIPRMSPQIDRPRRVQTDITATSTIPSKMARSAGDDTLDDNFLSVVLKISRRKSAPTNESRSLTETPPSGEMLRGRVLPLDSKTERFRAARPTQGAARGSVPGSMNATLFTYFAQKYKLRPYMHPPTLEAFLNIQDIFEQNAGYAKLASMYRLSQSWRIVGQLVSMDLRKRAELNRRQRQKRGLQVQSQTANRARLAGLIQNMLRHHAVRPSNPPTPLALPVQKKDAVATLQKESTSAMPTPRARPSGTRINGNDSFDQDLLPDIDSDNLVQLPPRVVEPTFRSSPSTFDDINMDGIDSSSDERAKKEHLANWKPRIRKPYELDHQAGPALRTPPPLVKHDSDESFGVFPPLSSSRAASLPDSMASSQSQLMANVSENLRHMNNDPRYDPKSSSLENFVKRFSEEDGLSSPEAERQNETQLPRIDTTAASGPDDFTNVPIAVPERPKSRAEVSKDMQTLARNNQESFASDTDLNPHSQQSPEEQLKFSKIDLKHDLPRSDAGLDARDHDRRISSQASATVVGFDIEPAEMKLAEQEHAVFDELTVDDFSTQPIVDPNASPELFPLITMLNQLVAYHTTSLSDAQSLSALLLLVMPLLPETSPLPKNVIEACLTHYIEHFSDLQIPETSIATFLSASTSHLLLAGLNPLMVESVLTAYHDQLGSLSLPINAALVRRLAYPTFPALYETALKENQVMFRCSSCRKPLLGQSPLRSKCVSCHARPPQCPVCWLPESPYDLHRGKKKKKKTKPPGDSALERNPTLLDPQDASRINSVYSHHSASRPSSSHGHSNHARTQPSSTDAQTATWTHPPSLFTSCLNCNHAAHAACLSVWHGLDAHAPTSSPALSPGGPRGPRSRIESSSGGTCPVEGCGCACIADPETRFGEVKFGVGSGGLLTPTLSGGVGRERRAVVEDDMRVGESRAVAGVRRKMGVQGRGSQGSGGLGVRGMEGMR